MFEVTVNTRRAVVGTKELITTSSAGIQVQFTFSEDWDSLSKIAIFRNGDDANLIPVAVPNSNLVTIPAQSCSEDFVDEPLFVGVYGTDGLGAVIIPTVWTSLGVLRPGAVTTDIITPPEPTPDMWAQILAIANEAAAIADECEGNEEQRDANEEARKASEESRVTEEENRAAAEAIREWMRNNFLRDGVSAETLAPESPATVRETTITDPETGASTTGSLVFGIPKGGKGDPGATEAGGVTYDETEDYPDGSVGAGISELTLDHNDLIRRNSANLLLGFGDFTDQTTGNQQWTWNKEHTTVTYSNTDPEIWGGGLQLYFKPSALPDELIPGETYQVEASGSLDATITFYFYTNGTQTSYVSLTSGWVTIPSDCNGLQILASFPNHGVYTGTLTVAIVNGPSNQELSKSIARLRSDVQQLNAGNIGYDSTATYQSGTAGAALKDLSRQLSDLDGDVADTQGMLAMVEATATASRNYSVGDLLIYDGKLYKVISAIATGATIIVGSNVTQTTVESQIAAGGGGGGGSEKTWRKFRDVTVTLEKPTSNVTYTEGADGITQFSFSVDDDGNSFEFTDIKVLAIVKNITGAGLVTMYSGARTSNIAIMTFRGSGTQGQARVYELESVLIDGVRFYSGIYGTQYATTINQLAPNQIVNDPAFGGNYNNFLNGFVNRATLFNTVNMITMFFGDATVEGRFIFFGK